MQYSFNVNLDAMMPPNMMNVPPQMVPPPHNMNLNMPMPSMYCFKPVSLDSNFISLQINKFNFLDPMMPPPVIPPSMPPNRERINEDHRNNQNEYREHDDKRGAPSSSSSTSSSSAWRSTRDKEREYRERERGTKNPYYIWAHFFTYCIILNLQISILPCR